MKAYLTRAVAALIVLIGVTIVSADPSTAADAETVRVRGPYINLQYGFRFSAPPGSQARRLAAPAPNHGATVDLGPGRHIEVSAAFDAPGYGSTGALLSARLAEGAVKHLQRGPARLGGRPAEQAVFAGGDACHVLIVRQEGPADSAINYTAELISNRREIRADRARFAHALASFRFISRKGSAASP